MSSHFSSSKFVTASVTALLVTCSAAADTTAARMTFAGNLRSSVLASSAALTVMGFLLVLNRESVWDSAAVTTEAAAQTPTFSVFVSWIAFSWTWTCVFRVLRGFEKAGETVRQGQAVITFAAVAFRVQRRRVHVFVQGQG